MEVDVAVEGIRVGAAKYGNGVYATRSFSGEDTVGQIQGRVIHDPDYTSDYCIDLAADCSLEPCSPYRFLNHSCSPNCQLVQYDLEDKGKIVGAEIWLETIRPIAVSEQLTIDYAWPASGAVLCECESDDCRGWIVAEEELNQISLVEPAESETAEDPAVSAV